MAQTTPPLVTAAPSPAPQRNDRTTFSTRVDAFVTWLIAAVTEFNALATNVYNNAIDAYNSSVSAAASSASATSAAGVTKWISGTTYTEGNTVWSPTDFFTYRRKVTGAGTTDPVSDSTNWSNIGTEKIANRDISGGYAGLTLFKLNLKNAANTFTNFFTNATTAARTWTMPDKSGTVALLDDRGMVLLGSATASNSAVIEFTSLDIATYKSFILAYSNIVPTTSGGALGLRGKVGSTVIQGSVDYAVANFIVNANATTAGDGAFASSILISGVSSTLGNTTDQNYTGSSEVSFTNKLQVTFKGFGLRANGAYLYNTGGGGNYSTTGIDGLQVFMNNGNISSGDFKLYGLKA